MTLTMLHGIGGGSRITFETERFHEKGEIYNSSGGNDIPESAQHTAIDLEMEGEVYSHSGWDTQVGLWTGCVD